MLYPYDLVGQATLLQLRDSTVHRQVNLEVVLNDVNEEYIETRFDPRVKSIVDSLPERVRNAIHDCMFEMFHLKSDFASYANIQVGPFTWTIHLDRKP